VLYRCRAWGAETTILQPRIDAFSDGFRPRSRGSRFTVTVLAVIPARYSSTRFPGKPLALIAGKPMVLHVCDRARAAGTVDRVVVATDDERIARVCREAGVEVEITDDAHATGTDRLAEVARRIPEDIYVNVQGDEPIISPVSIDIVVRSLQDSIPRGIEIATGYLEDATSAQLESRSAVQLVATLDGCIMSLSRLPIPCAFDETFRWTVHVGLYAFTRAALGRFAGWQRGPVERAESIELLRFLEHGERIACRPILPGSIGVDHPEDVQRVEAILASETAC